MITLTRKRDQKFDLGAWAACSVLLDYPSEQLIANLPNIKKLVGDHSGANELINFLQETDLQIVQQPWLGATKLLCDTLPELAGEGVEALRRLIEQGPPAEEVGLGGYGIDPAISMASPVLISGSSIQVGAPR